MKLNEVINAFHKSKNTICNIIAISTNISTWHIIGYEIGYDTRIKIEIVMYTDTVKNALAEILE